MSGNLRWTAAEDDFLRDHWQSEMTTIAIMKSLGRSRSGVQDRARRIGLGPREHDSRRSRKSWPTLRAFMLAIENQERPQFMTVLELHVATGICEQTILNTLNDLHALGKVHITAYRRAPNIKRWARVWRLGPGVDADQPMRTVAAISCKAYRKRLKTDPERASKIEARHKLRKLERAGLLIRRDPLTAALFGSV